MPQGELGLTFAENWPLPPPTNLLIVFDYALWSSAIAMIWKRIVIIQKAT
jgi:hypothetical protein